MKKQKKAMKLTALLFLIFSLCADTVSALEVSENEPSENMDEVNETEEPVFENEEENEPVIEEESDEETEQTETEIIEEEAAVSENTQAEQETRNDDHIIRIDSMNSGIVIIEGRTYYYKPVTHEMTKGAVIIDGSGYYFSDEGIMIRSSWIARGDSKWSYYGADGKQYVSKWVTLADENSKEEHTYYFTDQGYRAYGTVNIKGTDIVFDSDGVIKARNQLVTLGNTGYFFDGSGVMLKNSWVNITSGGWAYFGSDGTQYKSRWADLTDENGKNENRYYFNKNGYRVLGMNTISGSKYYFNETTGALEKNQFVRTGGHTCYVNGEGKVVTSSFKKDGVYYAVSPNTGYIMHGPGSFYYYNQKDSRWAGRRYGYWSFGGTGCVPTSIAMALSSLLGYAVTPVDVGDYLYYNTTTFNYGSDLGTSGSGNKYAADHWGINCENINSLADLKSVLSDGMIVGVLVNPGTFCPAGYTHEIILYGYSGGSVHVYDPLANASTGWYPVSTVWNQLSTDPMDLDAGNPVYVFYKD